MSQGYRDLMRSERRRTKLRQLPDRLILGLGYLTVAYILLRWIVWA